MFSLSLGDWLDPKVQIEWLARMLDTIERCPNIDFLLVTKRPELFQEKMRLVSATGSREDFLGAGEARGPVGHCVAHDWLCESFAPKNIWVIASAENQAMADKRIPELLKIPAVIRGLSCEPLLGPINLEPYICEDYRDGTVNEVPGLDWVIVGGESGKGARACDIAWVKSLVEQCAAAKVPCFVKQLGARPVYNGVQVQQRHAKGGEPSEWPAELRVRQFPSPL